MKKTLFAIAIIAIVLFAQVVIADTIVVDQGGNGDYTDIQPAIDVSANGDTIIVKPGTYSQFNSNGLDDLFIQGSGADQTFVYNTGTGDAANISNSNNTIISGLTFTAVAGNGMYIYNSTNCVISNCLFDGSQEEGINQYGYHFSSDNYVTNCIFMGNFNGIETGVSGYGHHSNIYVKNSIFLSNSNYALHIGGSCDYNCYYNNGSNGNNGTLGDNDFVANPMFVSSTDFHLQSSSPCINAGTPSPMYNDLDGSRNDLGIYGGPTAYPGEGAKITSLVVSPTNVATSQRLTIVGTAKTR